MALHHSLTLYQKRILLFSDLLFALAIAILVSVAVVSFWEISFFEILFVFLLGGIFIGSFWKKRFFMSVGVFCFFLGVALWWTLEKTDLSWVKQYEGKHFSGTVVLLSERVEEKYTQRIPFRFEVCQEEDCEKKTAFLRTEQGVSYGIGEKVKLDCTWDIPEYDEKTKTDWMRIFASRGPVLFCEDTTPEREGVYERDWKMMLSNARRFLEERLSHIIPYPESALGAGLLFGGTSGLSDEWQEKFSQTSMTHIVAVSGYNVTLLVQYLGIIAIGIGIKRQYAWLLSIGGIVGFIALIGFPASGVRAGIMGVLALIALRGGVMGGGIRALVLAGACMVLYNPFILRYDVGFQLSVLATLGIILGSPFIAKINKERFPAFVRIFVEIGVTTFFAQIFVIPLILMTFGLFSFLSFVANILVLWTIPLAMLTTLLALCLSIFGILFGSIGGILSWGILSYDLWVIDKLSRFSWASISLETMPFIFLFFYYFFVLGFFFWYAQKEKYEASLNCKKYGGEE